MPFIKIKYKIVCCLIFTAIWRLVENSTCANILVVALRKCLWCCWLKRCLCSTGLRAVQGQSQSTSSKLKRLYSIWKRLKCCLLQGSGENISLTTPHRTYHLTTLAEALYEHFKINVTFSLKPELFHNKLFSLSFNEVIEVKSKI